MTELAPGFYREVSFDEYASWQAANASTLDCFRRSPAHAYHLMSTGGKPRTKALELGWALHCAVLEPNRFERDFIVPPKVDRRTKLGKETWARFEAQNPGAELVPQERHGQISSMRDSIFQNKIARELFESKGASEISILWEDSVTAVRCKARIDRIAQVGEWPIVIDLKTMAEATQGGFLRSAVRYSFALQAAHYLDGLETLCPSPEGLPFRRFCFVCVESEPPHEVALYEFGQETLLEGAAMRARFLSQWKECIRSGSWPGYPETIECLDLPSWAYKNYARED